LTGWPPTQEQGGRFQPTKGASYGISEFFLFFVVQIVLVRQVEPRAGREQGRQGEHAEQQGTERARQRQGQPQLRQQQPLLAQQQQQVT
jgi:hypothetical protein